MDVALSFNSITETNIYKELIKRKWYYKENNASKFYNREFYQKNEKREPDNQCIPRYQLVRVKHAETFSTVYLLQVILSMLCIFLCMSHEIKIGKSHLLNRC